MKVVVDVSGSMYRFNGHDQRLERMLESALMVMEALYGFDDRFKYDIVGHSGEDNNIPFVLASKAPENEKQRLQVILFCLLVFPTKPLLAYSRQNYVILF